MLFREIVCSENYRRHINTLWAKYRDIFLMLRHVANTVTTATYRANWRTILFRFTVGRIEANAKNNESYQLFFLKSYIVTEQYTEKIYKHVKTPSCHNYLL